MVHAEQTLLADPDDDETRARLDRALAAEKSHQRRIALWTGEASRITNPAGRCDALLRAAQIAERDLGKPELGVTLLRAAWSIDPEDTAIVDAIARQLKQASPPTKLDPDDPSRARARIDFYREAASRATDVGRKIAHLERLAQIWEDEAQESDQALAVYNEILTLEPERRSAILGVARSAERVGARGDLFRALVMEADSTKSAALERSLLLRAAEIASVDLSDADTALDLVKRVLQKNGGDTKPCVSRSAFTSARGDTKRRWPSCGSCSSMFAKGPPPSRSPSKSRPPSSSACGAKVKRSRPTVRRA